MRFDGRGKGRFGDFRVRNDPLLGYLRNIRVTFHTQCYLIMTSNA